MWIVRWSLIGAIMLTLFGMVMINTDPIAVSIFGFEPIKIPVYLLFYSFFAVGMILIAAKQKATNSLELYWNRKILKETKKERDWSYNELIQLYEEIENQKLTEKQENDDDSLIDEEIIEPASTDKNDDKKGAGNNSETSEEV